MSWFDEAGRGGPIEIGEVMTAPNLDLLASIVAAGALVSCGRTSDGGAVGFTVTLDGRWRREYFRDADELQSWLLEAKEAVEREDRPPRASSRSRSRSRGS
jgi:hypothetical protein